MTSNADRPALSAAMRRHRCDDSGNELYTRFRYQPIRGLGYEPGVHRRDPSTIVRADDLYYVWYTRCTGPKYKWLNADIWSATSTDGVTWTERGPRGAWDDFSVFTANVLIAGGAYIPDKFDDPEDGQGFTWGPCHYGMSDWCFLLRFDCDLRRNCEKQLAWQHFRHYSTVRDVMLDPERFNVPGRALRGGR